MIFASGCWISSLNSTRALGICCSFVRFSGKFAMILPARETSFVSIAIPEPLRKDWRIGSKECEASAGASSTTVKNNRLGSHRQSIGECLFIRILKRTENNANEWKNPESSLLTPLPGACLKTELFLHLTSQFPDFPDQVSSSS